MYIPIFILVSTREVLMSLRLWRMTVLCLLAACAAAPVNGAFEQEAGGASTVAVETTVESSRIARATRVMAS